VYTAPRPGLYDDSMDLGIQLALSLSVPTLAVLVGILVNNARLTDLRNHVDMRFNAVNDRFEQMEKLFDEKLRRIEEVMDARLTRIEHELKIR
jgi:hypothetical protein